MRSTHPFWARSSGSRRWTRKLLMQQPEGETGTTAETKVCERLLTLPIGVLRRSAIMATNEFSLPDALHGRMNIEYWASRYPIIEQEKDEQLEQIFANVHDDERGLTSEELRFLVVWKSGTRNLGHLKNNKPEQVECYTRKAIHEKCVKPLCELSGVRIPTASAFLHFAFPEEFPIIDRRVLITTGRIDAENDVGIGIRLWREYLEWCPRTARHNEVSLRVPDRALWQYDVEASFKREFWPR